MNNPMRINHPLEDSLNAPASDILEAVYHGFRAQVDVKGKLAELYLNRRLADLKESGTISNFDWNDKDDKPDFVIHYKGRSIRIECKNVRSGEKSTLKKGKHKGWYKVEIQKTRGGKDPKTGIQTRGYSVDRFDILAACLFNQTGKWEYLFSVTKNLALRTDNPTLLQVFQAVPRMPQAKWTEDFLEVLKLATR